MPPWWLVRRRSSVPAAAKPTGKWRVFTERNRLPRLPQALLEQAFSHPSYVQERHEPSYASNQRLEFLGDAVLDIIIAEYLYAQFPEEPEGELTRRKAAIVRKTTLAEVAREMGVGEMLLLGRGEEDTGGRRKASLLADALEALIGAMYLAVGWQETRAFVLSRFGELLRHEALAAHDAKTALQELMQSRVKRLPVYELVRAIGPAHQRSFEVQVTYRGQPLGRGQGTGKRAAEQAAAAEAMARREEWLPLLEGREDTESHDDVLPG